MDNNKEAKLDKIKEALEELVFIDEPELDIALLAKSPEGPCLKDCEVHCTGQSGNCSNKGMCNGKCLGRGDCAQQSVSWCRDQGPECSSKTPCGNKCQGVNLCINY